jgi:hypothetical protein
LVGNNLFLQKFQNDLAVAMVELIKT